MKIKMVQKWGIFSACCLGPGIGLGLTPSFWFDQKIDRPYSCEMGEVLTRARFWPRDERDQPSFGAGVRVFCVIDMGERSVPSANVYAHGWKWKKTDTIFNECTISYRSSASICSYLLFLFVVLESASLFSPSHIHTQLHAFAFDFHPVKNNHFFSSTYIDCAVITKRFGIRKIFVDIPRKRRIL